MSRLIESIRLFNGELSRLEVHQARIENSYRAVFKEMPKWNLKTLLDAQSIPHSGLYKCRVVYDKENTQIEFAPYETKPIQTLKLVEASDIQYDHKWEDRKELNSAFAKRGDCDDVLIVKNGLITDTLYANIAFEKNGKWFTPQSHLLPGTMRQYLLKRGIVGKRVVSTENFREYNQFKLINAMLEFDGPAIDVSNIY